MAQSKKIVAIMFTSIANYTNIAKEDPSLALDILSEHDKILSKIILEFKGRIIKHINDSIFAEFISATDSTDCAIKIQRSLNEINDLNPKDFQINVGIGLHMAEVYEDDGDLFGDGINLAARIKSISGSKEILTTQAIYNSIRSEKNIFTRDVGRVILKNIQDPERIFKIYSSESDYDFETLDMVITNMKLRGVKFFDYKASENSNLSVAMHYVNNLGNNEDEFLCFGITDFVNIELGQLENIDTPNISAIMKLKELEDPIEIGKELKVDYLIQGSLMKMNDQMRLTVRMTNTINSNELWVNHWEESSEKINDIKNQIIIKTLKSLGVEIPTKFAVQASKKEINPQAYEFFFKGKFAYVKAKNSTDFELARSLFKKAYELQTDYIAAQVFYARISFQIRKYDEAISILQLSEEEGKKTNNNRDLVHVYKTFGLVYKQMGKYDKALDSLKEGLRLISLGDDSRTEQENLSQEASILNTLGQCYTLMTKPQKGIEYLKRSIQIHRSQDKPMYVANGLGNLALAHKKVGDYAKALSLLKETVEIFKENNVNTQLGNAHLNIAHLLYYIGHSSEAKNHYLEALELGKEFNSFPLIGMVYRSLGLLELNKNNATQAIKYLSKANRMHKDSKHQIAVEVTTTLLAQAYEQNSDYKNAEKYINQAVTLTTRRKHDDITNSYSEYYTLPSRCVKALVDSHLGNIGKDQLDKLLDEITTLHQDKQKGRELWWLAKSYYILGFKDKAHECQTLSKEDINKKAKLIRDKVIRKDYLELPPLHKQIFAPIENIFEKRNDTQDNQIKKENLTNVFKFCPACGFNNENSFKFCPGCGSSLESK